MMYATTRTSRRRGLSGYAMYPNGRPGLGLAPLAIPVIGKVAGFFQSSDPAKDAARVAAAQGLVMQAQSGGDLTKLLKQAQSGASGSASAKGKAAYASAAAQIQRLLAAQVSTPVAPVTVGGNVSLAGVSSAMGNPLVLGGLGLAVILLTRKQR